MMLSQNSSKLTYIQLTLITMSVMIGAGILTVPSVVLKYGIYGTIGWIVSAVMSLIIGISFAIICTKYNGGDLVDIIQQNFGNTAARISSLMVWFCCTMAITSISLTFVQYSVNIDASAFIKFGVCFGLIAFANFAHYISTSKRNYAQIIIQVFTIAKISVFSLVAIIGLVSLNMPNLLKAPNYDAIHAENQDIARMNEQESMMYRHRKNKASTALPVSPLQDIITCAGTAFFAFIGLESTVTLANETINPTVTVPAAIATAILGSSFIFIFNHIATVNALGLNEAGDNTPVRTAVEMLSAALIQKLHIFPLLKIISNVFIYLTNVVINIYNAFMTIIFGGIQPIYCNDIYVYNVLVPLVFRGIQPAYYVKPMNYINNIYGAKPMNYIKHINYIHNISDIAFGIGSLVRTLAVAGCLGSIMAFVLFIGKLLNRAHTLESVDGFRAKYSILSSCISLFACMMNIFYQCQLSSIISIATMMMLFAYKLLALSGLKSLRSNMHRLLCLIALALCFILNIPSLKLTYSMIASFIIKTLMIS